MFDETMIQKLRDHGSYFKTCISFVPAEHYFERPQVDQEKYYVKKKLKTPDLEIKKASKKAKKLKLDPEAVKLTDEIIDEHDKTDEVPVESVKVASKKEKSMPTETEKVQTGDDAVVSENASPLEALRQKLQQRIKDIRSKRGGKHHSQKVKDLKLNKDNIVQPKVKVGDIPVSKNESGEIVYSKFDLGENKKRKKPALDTLSTLRKLESKKQKLEELKKKDPAKATQIIEKQEFNKAIQMINGEKVKDDVGLLKKTLKRKQKMKEKSSKEWHERKKNVTVQMDQKAKKRNENIQKKILEKKKKRPGFEGSTKKFKK